MQKELKERLPQWYEEIGNTDKIILTNDADALLSYYYLNKKFGCNAGGFYTFNGIYFCTDDRQNLIGVDADFMQGRTFGNHLTLFHKNKNAVNLNNIYKLKYYQKYPFSTVLLILSLYDFDLQSFTDEQLKVILAIDSAYKGYYTERQVFKDVYLKWLDRLDIRFLEDRILKNMTVQDFKDIQKQYSLDGTIELVGSQLYTNINLGRLSLTFNDIIELPGDRFYLHKKYEYKTINPMFESVPDKDKIISMAFTDSKTLKMTLK